MIHPCKGDAYVFSRVVKGARDVAKVEMNYTRVAKTNPTIELRYNWSCPSKKICFELGEGDVALGRGIIARGHDFESSMKPSKSYKNRKDVNWSHYAR